jgi:DNA-binding SARP family transcriptional activator
MAPLEVRLLGPPLVAWNGALLSIPRRRARALLYRLAIDLQPVAREHLVYLFWANTADDRAHRDLTHLLTHLRRALPNPDAIQSTADFIFLDSRQVWCDTHAFLHLFRGPHVTATPDLLQEAESLCRGALLDGFTLDGCPEFEEWLTLERAVWERRYLALLSTMEVQARSSGDLGLTVRSAQHSMSAEIMDPETHRRLVESRLALGEYEMVRRHWEAIRGLLEEEEVLA